MSEPGGGAVLVIGDVMTDIVVRPEGALAHGADRRAEIRVLPGGSGANQAAWLARYGMRTRFAARVGQLEHAYQSRLLAEAGVEARLAADAALPTGTIVTLLSPDGERSFLTDRGANDALCTPDLPLSLLDGVVFLHISAYALFAEGPRAAVAALIDAARDRRIAFSIDPASYSFLEEFGAEAFFACTQGARLLAPNSAEAAVLTGVSDANQQMDILARRYDIVAIKRGGLGAVAASQGARWTVSAPTVEVLDSTGAGDAFLAGFLADWLQGRGIEAALRRGVAAGSEAVTFLGGRPQSAALSTTFTDL